VPSVEAQIEAEEACLWAHYYDPLTCWAVLEVLGGGLAEAKREHAAARAAGDRDRAAALALEIIDLTEVAAGMREGLDCQRSRFLADGLPWPLASLVAVR
jgi:hypothetical protein